MGRGAKQEFRQSAFPNGVWERGERGSIHISIPRGISARRTGPPRAPGREAGPARAKNVTVCPPPGCNLGRGLGAEARGMAGRQPPLGVQHIHKLAGAARVEDLGDGPLLDRFLARRDGEAFAALVRRHGPMVLGVCRRVLRDGHTAEDAFQATFLVLLRRARTLDRRRSLAGWLYTVAYHIALRARTDAERRRRTEAAAGGPHTQGPAEPQAEWRWRELRPVLDEELDRLPEQCRAPVVLCYLEGRTNEEAGRLLGWPVGTVKSRLARARDLLRTRLARRGVTLGVPLSAGLFTGSLGQAVA